MAGYSGYSMSNNAVKAYDEGLVPASKIKGVPSVLVKEYCSASEWHHTSKHYNCTNFYEVAYVRITFGLNPLDGSALSDHDDNATTWAELGNPNAIAALVNHKRKQAELKKTLPKREAENQARLIEAQKELADDRQRAESAKSLKRAELLASDEKAKKFSGLIMISPLSYEYLNNDGTLSCGGYKIKGSVFVTGDFQLFRKKTIVTFNINGKDFTVNTRPMKSRELPAQEWFYGIQLPQRLEHLKSLHFHKCFATEKWFNENAEGFELKW